MTWCRWGTAKMACEENRYRILNGSGKSALGRRLAESVTGMALGAAGGPGCCNAEQVDTPAAQAFDNAARWFLEVSACAADHYDHRGLGEWSVRDLLGHTSRSLSTVETYLDAASGQPSPVDLADAVAYYPGRRPRPRLLRRGGRPRTRGRRRARRGPDDSTGPDEALRGGLLRTAARPVPARNADQPRETQPRSGGSGHAANRRLRPLAFVSIADCQRHWSADAGCAGRRGCRQTLLGPR